MKCATENSHVYFHCGKSFRLEIFSEVLLCSRCSVEAVEHRRNLTLLKPEVETFVRSGAQSFGSANKVRSETDNDLPRKFLTEDFALPSKKQIHEALDRSWFFNKFENSGEKKCLRSKRSSTRPRESFEKEFGLPLSNDVSSEQYYQLCAVLWVINLLKLPGTLRSFRNSFKN